MLSDRRRPPVLALLALLAAAVGLSGCSETYTQASERVVDRKVRVTTTTNFITDTVRRIGGDRVEVTGLMGPGVDPHLYKASARDVKTMRDADVVLYGGLELEGRMADVFERLAERQTTVEITRDIPRSELLAPPPGSAPEERYDPHVWFDVAKWRRVARTVADTLAAKDPADAATYERNLRAYDAELARTDDYVRRRLQAIPRAQRLLVTSHDAFAYLGRRYGLDVAAIQGISTAAEATTSDIGRIARVLAERRVPAAFVESSVPRQTVEAVLAATRSLGHEARIGGELFTDAAGDEGTPEGTYTGMVRANADRIAEGLR